ncbi:hypothetical protein BDZ45DRAFT_744095 [Acephala macrosclerotiorum]|nr:hypothetical protein BDZ45DRAFT_744095 [Acephala macrosclerotiorum]
MRHSILAALLALPPVALTLSTAAISPTTSATPVAPSIAFTSLGYYSTTTIALGLPSRVVGLKLIRDLWRSLGHKYLHVRIIYPNTKYWAHATARYRYRFNGLLKFLESGVDFSISAIIVLVDAYGIKIYNCHLDFISTAICIPALLYK